MTVYDLLIVGGGPGGYTAALYAARAGMRALVLEKFSAGGQMTETPWIENYPGFDAGIDGFTLGERMQKGAERFGAETLRTEVLSLDLQKNPKTVKTDMGELLAHTVILATGAVHKHLGLPREEELVGRGVGYCATCDGMLFRGKTVAVVGGGNAAVSDALALSKICAKVYLIHRRDRLRAEKRAEEQLRAVGNVEFILESRAIELLGDERLTGVVLERVTDGERSTLLLDGLFISIGRTPETAMVEGKLALDAEGYILADESTETSIPGVFAVGDVRKKPFRQIVTAVADGAVAAHFAEKYLDGMAR